MLNPGYAVREWCGMFIGSQLMFIMIGYALYWVIMKKNYKIATADCFILLFMILYTTLSFDTPVWWSLIIVLVVFIFAFSRSNILINRIALLLGKYSLEIFLLYNAVIIILMRLLKDALQRRHELQGVGGQGDIFQRNRRR